MANLSKYDILKLLAGKMPFYGATQWLKTPNEGLGNEAPSDLLKKGDVEVVYKQLKKELKTKK